MREAYREGDPPRPDEYAVKSALRETLSKDPGYNDWVREKFGGVIADEHIFRGYSDTTGSAMYKPHTLQNVVKHMTRKLRDGEGFSYGVGNIRAKLTPKFRSMRQLKSESGRIVDRPAFEILKKEVDDEFIALGDRLQPLSKYGKDHNGFLDMLAEHMKEAIDTRNVRKTFAEYYDSLGDDDIRAVGDFMQKLRDLPTQYFEAKLPRAVGIAEFKAAVVPDDVSPKTLEALKRAGITDIRTYKRNDEASRTAAINQDNGLKFQRARGKPAPNLKGSTHLSAEDRARYKPLINATITAIRDVVPNARIAAFRTIEGGAAKGALYINPRLGSLIAFALESREGVNTDAPGTGRHEAFHLVEDMKVMRPFEVDAIEDAAIAGNWIAKHNIPERYPDLAGDRDKMMREAKAEEFREGRPTRWKGYPQLIRRAFLRIDAVLTKMAIAARRAMGRDVTADQVMRLIETGAVARRGGHGPNKKSVMMQRTENKPAVGSAEPEGITAYHGSPHTFDRFDTSKIGTGEGAQAYGHGLYFADSEGVAQSYRDALGGLDFKLDGRAPVSVAEKSIFNHLTSARSPRAGVVDDALIKDVMAGLSDNAATHGFTGPGAMLKREMEEMRGKPYSFSDQGSMYQVRLNVKPDELLDWDAPLSGQSEQTRAAIGKIAKDFEGYDRFDNPSLAAVRGEHPRSKSYVPTGEEIVREIGAKGLDSATSAKLKAAGIKGIRYKDAGSRTQSDAPYWKLVRDDGTTVLEITSKERAQAELKKVGGGFRLEGPFDPATYNYVIFDAKLIDILKRYGIAMTVGAAGTAIVSGKDMPDEIAAQMGAES